MSVYVNDTACACVSSAGLIDFCVCVFRCQKPGQLAHPDLPSVTEEDEDDEEVVEMETVVIEPPVERWDCETIISEY